MTSADHGEGRSAVQIAPFALVRVAGLPLRQLASMSAPRSAELLVSTVVALAKLESLRVQAEDQLFALVPTLIDGRTRAAALQLRRDVHAGRTPQGRIADDENLLRQLAPEQQDDLWHWLDTRRQITELSALGEKTLDHETHSILRPALWSTIDDHGFSQGIALASPHLRHSLNEAKRSKPRASAATKVEVALLRYVLRAACKTSPFSTFMDVGAATVNPDAKDDFGPLRTAPRGTSLFLNRGIVARLYKTGVRAVSSEDPTLFHPNPTLRRETRASLQALAAEQVSLLGRPWRQERVSRFHFHEALIDLLVNLPSSFSMTWLLQELAQAGLTTEHARQFAEKLIERELILPRAIVDAFSVDALKESAQGLRTSRSPNASVVVSALHALEESVDPRGHAHWAQRIKSDQNVRRIDTATLEQLGVESPETYRNVFFEESRLEGIVGNIGPRLHGLLSEVGIFLRDQLALRPEYIRLRDAFQEHYGRTGICTDIVGFLTQQAISLVDLPEWGAAPNELLRQAPDVPPNPGVSTGVTAFVQIAAERNDGHDCRELVVVNRVYEGVGWLSARHITGNDSDATALRSRMRRWLEDVYAPAEPIDFPLSGDCNDLQAHPRLTRRVLAWPVEPMRSDRDNVLSVSDVSLRHNDVTGMLEFLDNDGRPIAPVYLGSVLPVPTWGPAFGLTVLANPIKILRPSMAGPVADGANVLFAPRRVYGRVVLTRASWSVRSNYLLEKSLRAGGFQRLVNLARLCETNAIPTVFFAQAERWADALRVDSLINARKPTFIDTHNPFCVDLLERLAYDADSIVLTEVLPAHQEAWPARNGERHVTELQVEMRVSASG